MLFWNRWNQESAGVAHRPVVFTSTFLGKTPVTRQTRRTFNRFRANWNGPINLGRDCLQHSFSLPRLDFHQEWMECIKRNLIARFWTFCHSCFDSLSCNTYAQHIVWAKAFWPSNVVARTPFNFGYYYYALYVRDEKACTPNPFNRTLSSPGIHFLTSPW